VAAGRGPGGVVATAGAGGGQRERGDDEQSEAGSPGDHRAGPQAAGGGDCSGTPPRSGAARPGKATSSRVTPIHRQRTVTDRQRSADATNGVHGAVAGGPIVPGKYSKLRRHVGRSRELVERLPAEHPAASGPPLRANGESEGHPGGVGTMTLQRPPEPSPDDVPVGATLAPQSPKSRSYSSLSPRNWKVRTKLAAVLLVPAIAFLVIAGINMAGQIGNARDYGRSANVAAFGR